MTLEVREREPRALLEREAGGEVAHPRDESGLDHAGHPESTHLVEIARARQHDVLNAQSMVGLETGRGGAPGGEGRCEAHVADGVDGNTEATSDSRANMVVDAR